MGKNKKSAPKVARNPRVDTFWWPTKTNIERCTESQRAVAAKDGPARRTQAVARRPAPCYLSKSLSSDNKSHCLHGEKGWIEEGQWYYTVRAPKWIVHVDCCDAFLAKHRAMVESKEWKEQEKNRMVPMEKEVSNNPAVVAALAEIKGTVSEVSPEPLYAPTPTTAKSLPVSNATYEFRIAELEIENEALRRWKASAQAYIEKLQGN